MIVVAILAETGVFDYLAVYAYKVSQNMQNSLMALVMKLKICLCLCFSLFFFFR